jgi:hypothetical protein
VHLTRVTATAMQLTERLLDVNADLTQGRPDMRDRYDNPNIERDIVLLLRNKWGSPYYTQHPEP